ncbi:hypothetical protein [Erwinia psidii]|nr:hypothetical protein [Erwinia psidii]
MAKVSTRNEITIGGRRLANINHTSNKALVLRQWSLSCLKYSLL